MEKLRSSLIAIAGEALSLLGCSDSATEDGGGGSNTEPAGHRDSVHHGPQTVHCGGHAS